MRTSNRCHQQANTLNDYGDHSLHNQLAGLHLWQHGETQRGLIKHIDVIEGARWSEVKMPKATVVIGNCFKDTSWTPRLTLKHALLQGRAIFPLPVHANNRSNASRETCIPDINCWMAKCISWKTSFTALQNRFIDSRPVDSPIWY